MEIDDEDIVIYGTDMQKYLTTIGCMEFEVSEQKNNENFKRNKKYSKTINNTTQRVTKDLELYITLIKIILESQLMFKEDTLFIKEFIPSEHVEFSYFTLFITKRNSYTFFILCIYYGLTNVLTSNYYNKWITIILSMWFSYIFVDVLYDFNRKLKVKNIVSKMIESMKKLSLLIQKITHFIHECQNLHSIHSCNDLYMNKNSNSFFYLLMPELKKILLTVTQSLINNLVCNISEVHTFFPLKDSANNIINVSLTDHNIDLQNTSLENINKAKYTFFLLQSECLKQLTLCFSPIFWASESYQQINKLIKNMNNIEKIYLSCYNDLSEEYNIFSLFQNKNTNYNNQINDNNHINSDLKLKIYNLRSNLQNIIVLVRFLEDYFETSCYSINDLNSKLNVLLKETNNFSELISTLQIYILKRNSNIKNDIPLLINSTKEIDNDIEMNESTDIVCQQDQLFFGISDEFTEKIDNTILDKKIFDISTNHNFMSELKIALKDKQNEWNKRESKLLKLHPELNYINDEEQCETSDDIKKNNKLELGTPNNDYSITTQLIDKNIANEVAIIASKWSSVIKSFDNSDSDSDSDS